MDNRLYFPGPVDFFRRNIHPCIVSIDIKKNPGYTVRRQACIREYGKTAKTTRNKLNPAPQKPDGPVQKKNKLYLTIMKEIRNQIISGLLKYGDKVLTELEICEKYHVSRISAKKALGELAMQGLIERRVGSGSFVIYSPIEHLLVGIYSLSDELKKRGMVPSFKIIDFKEVAIRDLPNIASIDLKKKMFLESDDHVWAFRRIRYANGHIIALDTTFIPVKYCPSLSADDINKFVSVYTILRERFDCAPDRAQEYLYARPITAEEAICLGVNEDSPALKVTRVGYSRGRPTFYNYRTYKGESYYYRIDLLSKPEFDEQ
jgi:GntR family transcriptional regulator